MAPKTSPLTSIEGETAPLQTFTLTDADDGEAQSFALSGADVSSFELGTTSGALRLAATTAAGSYSLTVTGTSGSRADAFTLTVNVATDAAPIISTTSFSLAENTNNPITLTATEANNDDVVFALQSGPDAEHFTFADGGAGANTATLTFNAVPDFEAPLDEGGNNIYQLSVQASSTTGGRAARTTTETITITVTGVDEDPPVLAPKTSPLTSIEGETAPLQTFTLTDADDGEAQSFALSGADVSSFTLDPTTGVLTLATTTAAGSYDLTVTGISGDRADAFPLTVNVAADAAPIISTTSFSLAENTNNPITLTATEANNDDVLFALQSGMDAEHFTFADGGAGDNTATLTFNAAPDFEAPLDEGGNNIYELSVQASSITGARAARTTTETIRIEVTPVDEFAPVLAPKTSPLTSIEGETAPLQTFTLTDADDGEAQSFALSGADVSSFELGTTSGALRLDTATTAGSYSLTVTGTSGSQADTFTFTVDVATDAAPVFVETSFSLAENTNNPIVLAATEANNDDVVFTLQSGMDAGRFTLADGGAGANTATLTFNAVPDFEAPLDEGGNNIYQLSVQASSITGARAARTTTETITITVTGVDEHLPTLAVTPGPYNLAENSTAVIATLTAADPDDGDTVSLIKTGADEALFDLNAATGALTFASAPDFENPRGIPLSGDNTNIYSLSVQATSTSGSDTPPNERRSAALDLVITVTGVDEFAPVLAPKTSPLTSIEGEMAPLQTFTLTDADDGEAQSFALSGADVSSFELNPTTGVLRLDTTTTAGSYSLTVTGTSGSRADSFPLIVNVAGDAAPIISTTSFSLAENTNNPITLTATEANNDDVVFTLQSGMDAGRFTFADGGAGADTATLTFNAAPDFEDPQDDGGNNIYQVSVQASSMTGTRAARTTTETIRIEVTPVDEDAPVLAPKTSPLTSIEGEMAPLQTFTLTDADDGEAQSFALSGADVSSFELNPTTGVLRLDTTTTAGSYSLTVTGTSGSRADSFPLIVNVAGDAAPIISTTSFSLAENTNNPITLAATEANNDDVMFTLQSGMDAGRFTLADGGAADNTAALTFNAVPDFEVPLDEGGNNIYELSVQASSTTGGRAARTTTETITITVTGVDEFAPVLAPKTSPLTSIEGETAPLQTFTLTDADDGEAQSFALSGADVSSFELGTTSGALRLAATTAAGSYSLTVTGTSGSRADSFTFTVDVAADAAPIISTASFSLAENTNNPITLAATEANNDDVLFTLQSGMDAGRFTLADGGAADNTATLTFNAVPDFEVPLDEGGNNIYELSVQASSITGARAARTTTETITITVTGVDEFAPVLTPKTSPLTSIEGETAPLQTFTLTDADDGEAQSFALSGADVSSFELGTTSGVLRLATTTAAGSYSLTVTGTSGSRADSFTFTVDVAADAAPVFVETSFSLAENTNNPITLTATEANNDDVLFTLQSGMDTGRFTLADGGAADNTAALTFNAVPDFEDPQDDGGNNIYQVSVQASSTTGARAARTTTETITITVTGVDEDPPVLAPKTSPLTSIEGETAPLQTFTLTDADDGEAQSFALSGADVSSFELGTTSGVLRLDTATAAGSYSLTVTGTSGSRADAFTFTVNVAADAAPIISTTSFSLAENTNNPITLTATEANNDDVLFTLQSGMDTGRFTLADGGAADNTAALTFNAVPDFEDPQDEGGNNIYQVSVQASSTTGARAARTTTETIRIEVTPVDEFAPVLTPKTSPLTSIEGETAPLQTFTLTDADDGEAQSFALSGADVSSFELNPTSGALTLAATTAAGSYSLTVTGTSGSRVDSFALTVDVAADAAPIISTTSFSLAENTNNPITLTAAEANNDDVVFTLQSGMDAGRFTFADGGAGDNTATLTFNAVPDFEAPLDEGGNNIYELSVQASSITGARAARTTTETIRITVTPVDEFAPVLAPKTSPLTSIEGETDVLQTFTLTDADDGEAQSFALSGADVSSFELGTTSGALTLATTTTAGSYNLTVTGTSGSRADSFALTVNVAGDAAPIISTTSFSVPENTNNPITLTAAEANNDDVVFTLQSGMDAGRFTFADGGAGDNTATLTFNAVPDFEAPLDEGGNNIYQLSVQASSITGARAARTTTETIRITVTPVDEFAPVLAPKTSPLTSIEGETAPLQTFTLTDADDGEAQSFALSGADVSSFELGTTSGVLRLAATTAAGSYSLTVTGTSGSQADTFTFTVDVAADAAPIISTTSFSLAENTNNPITLTATEANNDDVLFTLQSGMDAGRFTFADGGAGDNTATLTFNAVPDFEDPQDDGGNNIYQLSVQASSTTGARAARTTTETITITVTGVDEHLPVLAPKTSPLTSIEGETAPLQTFTLTDADAGEAQSFALSGTDVSSFALNPTTGVFRLAATTAAGSYSLTVSAASAGRADSFPLIVNVAGDAAPIISTTSFSLAENTNNPITLTATEANNDDVVFALQSGMDAEHFTLADGGAADNTAALTFNAVPDFEAPLDDGGNNIYQVSVQASSTTGARAARTTTETITITVTPVDEFAPVLAPKTSPLTSIEGETAPLQTFTLTDADDGEAQSFALSGADVSSFELNPTSGALRLAATTAAGNYSLTVTGTSGSRADAFTFTVDVAGDAAPIISTTSFSLAENTNNPITLTATEANNDDVLFALQSGMDAGRFTLADGGASANTATLTFQDVPDFEDPQDDGGNNIYELSVQASSITGARAARTTTETITITVTPVDEDPPVLAPKTSPLTSIEGETDVLQTFTLTDADDGEAQSFALSGADQDLFTLDPTTGVLTLATTTAAGSYDLTVTGISGDREDAFTFTVNVAADAAPIISTTSFSLAENTNNPITLTATEANNDDVVFTLQSGMDAGRFTLADGGAADNTAALTFNAVPDFEAPLDEGGNNIYQLSVQASSITGARAARTTTETITITVTGVDEHLPVLAPKTSPLTSIEGETAPLQTFTLTDADDGEAQAFALSGADVSSFELNPTSGVLRLAATTAAGSYSLTVTGTSGSRVDSFALTVDVAADAAPVFVETSFSLAENTNNPITLTATEANNDDVMFTLQSGMDAGRFTLADGGAADNTAALTFQDVPDFEDPQDEGGNNIYQLSVQASSMTGTRAARTTTETITITVTPVDEFAPVLAPKTSPLTSIEGETAPLQTFTLTDADDGEAQSFALSGTDQDLFTLDPTTGVLTLATTTTAGSYNLTVTGTTATPADPATSTLAMMRSDSFDLTVNVAADAAPIISTTSFSLAENTNNPITLTATEANNDDVTFALQSGPDDGRFTFADGGAGTNTATLTFQDAPDFENPLDEGGNNIYQLSVQASSTTGARAARTTTETITITVTGVDEDAPVLAPKTSPLTSIEGETAVLQTFTLTDADDGEVQSFALSGADVSSFELGTTSGVLRLDTATAAGSYSLTVTGTTATPADPATSTLAMMRSDSFDLIVNVAGDAAPIISTTSFSLAENTNNPITLTATEANNDDVMFTLQSGPDAGRFTFADGGAGTNTATLTFQDAPDFENPLDEGGNNIYQLSVQASSTTGARAARTTTETITITVTPVDEFAPVLAPKTSPLTTTEGEAAVLQTFTLVDADDGEAQAFALSGADQDLFTLDPTTGVLTLATATGAGNYDLIVTGTSGSRVDAFTFTVNVMSDNPAVFADTEFDLPENSDPPQVMLSATDPDGATVTLTLMNVQDGALFSLEDSSSTGGTTIANLRFVDPPDFENPADTATSGSDTAGNNIYLVRVRASSMNLSGVAVPTTETITITVTGVDEDPPVLAPKTSPLTSIEGETAPLQTFTLTDADDGEAQSFALSGADVSSFELGTTSGALRLAATTTAGSYSLTVTGTSGSRADSFPLIVNVAGDAAPIISTTSFSLAENTNNPITLTATEANNDDVVFALQDTLDAEHFTFADGGAGANTATLTFQDVPDFEAPLDEGGNNIYQLSVQASSTTGARAARTTTETITIRITPVDEFAPVLVPKTSPLTSIEGETAPLQTFTLTDADDGEAQSFALSGADVSSFELGTTSGVLRLDTATAAGSYSLTVSGTSGSRADAFALTVNVATDAAPIISTTSFSLAENTNNPITLTATEANNDDVVFTLQSGMDAGRFTFADGGAGANTATLTFNAVPDFEAPLDEGGNNIYQVSVQASSMTGTRAARTTTETITITVTPVDEFAPVLAPKTSPLTTTEGETAALQTFTLVDADDGEVQSFALSGTGANSFELDSTTGALRLDTATTAGSYSLTVTGTSGSRADAFTFTVNVMSDNPAVFADTEFDLPENSDPPQVMLSATDADGATVTLTLTNAQDGDLFSLEDSLSTGGTTMANLRFIAQPDFENPVDAATADGDAAGNNIYLVRVRASSMDLNGVVVRTTENISIRVTGVDEHLPTLAVTPGPYNLAENSTAVIATLTAADQDDGDRVRLSTSGTDAALFDLDAATGELTFVSAPDFENPRGVPFATANTNTYNLLVQAISTSTPGSGTPPNERRSITSILTIRVTPVDEDAPVLAPKTSPLTRVEGTTGALQTFSLTDADAGEVQAFALSGADARSFELNATTGALRLAAATGAGSYSLTVTGTSGSRADAFTFTVNIAADAAPAFVETSFSVAENTNNPIVLTATDANNDDVVFTLQNTPDAPRFTFADGGAANNTATLTFNAAPDFEVPLDDGRNNIYELSVQASSMAATRAPRTITETIRIAVTGVDDNDPVLTTTQATYEVPENSTEPIVTLQGTDVEGDTLRFEIADGAGNSPDRAHFTLDASTGVLRFASPQDFEAPNDANTDRMYQITVQATSASTSTSTSAATSDSGSPSRTSNTLALAIRLTAIDEADPTITPAQATYTFRTGATGTIATFTIEDSDAGETRRFSALEAAPGSGTNLTAFHFNTGSGVLSFQGPAANATSALIITATSNAKAALLAITLTVDGTDAPPAFVETTFSQAENTTPTLTLTATEADGDDVSFALQSGKDATYFALTDGGAAANTATLTFRNAPNFESPQGATLLPGDHGKNTYQMNVRAASTTSPNTEQTMTQLITINVTDADDPPTFTTARDALMIMEGETATTGVLEAIDQDGDPVTLALTGGADQNQFTLTTTGTVLSFISAPDFEAPADTDTNNIYEVEITANSTGSATGATALSAVRTFNITVTDADDNAPELTSPTTFQIQSGETAVATLEATDADAGDTETIVFALSGGADQSQFALTRAGVLSFTSAADFAEPTDADGDNIYAIEITLTSGSRPHTTQAALEIEVINIDHQSRQRIGNVILAHIARSLADNTQDIIFARTSGRLTNNLTLSNRQGDLDDLIKGIKGFSFMRKFDAKKAAADAYATGTTTQTKERGFALWAKGHIRTFSASPNETAINNFSGHIYNLNLGADYQTGALLFGGLVTASQSSVKFTSGSTEGQGRIRTKLTTFAPYVHLRFQSGTELWGSAGFGQGRMRYQSETTDDGFERTDLKYAQFAGGLYQPLKALQKTNLALRLDGYTARLKAEAREDVFLAMTGDVSRVRALLEVGYRRQGAEKGVLDAKLNGGARLERGDIGKGVGLEFGAEITYANPASGLSLSADINAILLHTAQKYRHLDAGLRFLLGPGIKKRGLQLRLEPRIGGGATPVAPLWDGAPVGGSDSPAGQLGISGLGQLQTALGLSYGFAARQSLLTPFTEMRLDDRGAPIDLMLGMRFSRANLPINITLYTQKALGTTGVHLRLNWR